MTMCCPALNDNGISDSLDDPSAGALSGIILILSRRSISDLHFVLGKSLYRLSRRIGEKRHFPHFEGVILQNRHIDKPIKADTLHGIKHSPGGISVC